MKRSEIVVHKSYACSDGKIRFVDSIADAHIHNTPYADKQVTGVVKDNNTPFHMSLRTFSKLAITYVKAQKSN